MKTKTTQRKQGVSLIVLVITIIVMVILAGAIVLTLNNNGIIAKAEDAVEQTNLATVKELTQMAWAEAYAGGVRTQEELKAAVDESLEDSKIDVTKYTIIVTTSGVTVELKVPNANPWVVATVDGVPIPKGFVASPYGEDTVNGIPAENTRAGGLVIYELTEEEMKKGATTLPATETQHTSWTTRNQYVWVPVADLSVNELTGRGFDGLNEYWQAVHWEAVPGFDLTATYDNPEYQDCMDIHGISEDCIEWNGNPTIKAEDFVTQTTIDEVTEMYESVEKYGGFYIARYEAGLDLDNHTTNSDKTLRTEVHSKMNKAPYNWIGWSNSDTMTVETGGAVEVARGMYSKTNANYGVVSTLTYGVQWDAVVQWLEDKGIDILDSTNYGNYYNSEIPNATFNTGASVSKDNGETYTTIASTYSKASNDTPLLTTGATTVARVNNIYDMAGNVEEWTMEGFDDNSRVTGGGSFGNHGAGGPVSYRGVYKPNFAHQSLRFPCLTLHKEVAPFTCVASTWEYV